MRDFWQPAAKKWSDPLKEASLKNKDIALNNVLVFAPWFRVGTGQGKTGSFRDNFTGGQTTSATFSGW
jgi:hypothetical protein